MGIKQPVFAIQLENIEIFMDCCLSVKSVNISPIKILCYMLIGELTSCNIWSIQHDITGYLLCNEIIIVINNYPTGITNVIINKIILSSVAGKSQEFTKPTEVLWFHKFLFYDHHREGTVTSAVLDHKRQ